MVGQRGKSDDHYLFQKDIKEKIRVKDMKVVAIIQARMGSTRLPGKVLQKVLGKPLLEYQIERVKSAKNIDEIVIATTKCPSDQEIVDFCESASISYFRGSENDVLSRYYEASKMYNADIIVRISSDCPLIDPRIIDLVVEEYLQNTNVDYVSNSLERTFPIGMDTEVFSFSLLEEINNLANSATHREHVTSYIYDASNHYRIKQVKQVSDNSYIRLTVDTPEDLKLVTQILNILYKENQFFSLEEILRVLKDNPELVLINQHIKQKKGN